MSSLISTALTPAPALSSMSPSLSAQKGEFINFFIFEHGLGLIHSERSVWRFSDFFL